MAAPARGARALCPVPASAASNVFADTVGVEVIWRIHHGWPSWFSISTVTLFAVMVLVASSLVLKLMPAIWVLHALSE